jgi:hypothetical protein
MALMFSIMQEKGALDRGFEKELLAEHEAQFEPDAPLGHCVFIVRYIFCIYL